MSEIPAVEAAAGQQNATPAPGPPTWERASLSGFDFGAPAQPLAPPSSAVVKRGPDGKKLVALITAVVVLAGAAGSWLLLRDTGPPPARLTVRLDEGRSYPFTVNARTEVQTERDGISRERISSISGTLTLKVLGPRGDGSSAAKGTLDVSNGSVNGAPLEPQAVQNRMRLGPELAFGRGAVFSSKADALLVLPALFPATPSNQVEPGESWSVPVRFTHQGGVFSGLVQGRFAHYDESSEERLAVVEGVTAGSVRGSPLFGTGEVLFQHTSWLDVETGAIVRSAGVYAVDGKVRSSTPTRVMVTSAFELS